MRPVLHPFQCQAKGQEEEEEEEVSILRKEEKKKRREKKRREKNKNKAAQTPSPRLLGAIVHASPREKRIRLIIPFFLPLLLPYYCISNVVRRGNEIPHGREREGGGGKRGRKETRVPLFPFLSLRRSHRGNKKESRDRKTSISKHTVGTS